MAGSRSISGFQGVGPMAKAMSIAGLIAGGLVALLFVLDLAVGFPFGRVSALMDAGFILCGAGLAYLSWNAMADLP
jgi:hypothetical protein